MYFVYIIECRDQSLYTGITTDVARRFDEHRRGVGARYTAARGATKVVYIEECESRSAALKREANIKSLSRAQKLALVRAKK